MSQRYTELSQFRTTFDIPRSEFKIDHKLPIFSIGSCFAEHIAARMKHHLFDIHTNPNGIIFNPVSLAINIRNLIDGKTSNQSDLVLHNGLWHSWNHHHTCSGIDPDKVAVQLNQSATLAANHLAKSKILLVTLGTAFAYRYIETGELVANCHKIPNNQFEKIRLGDHRIIGEWQDTIELLLSQTPDLNIIMTVSPVRHIKDGLVANQRSKATLLLAIEALTQEFEQVHYFPSYEIMMDDLRDYRFYNSDMLHPSDQAVDYIWDRFVDTYMDEQTCSIMKEVYQLQLAKAHRSMHPESAEAVAFRESTDKKWVEMMERYPYLSK